MPVTDALKAAYAYHRADFRARPWRNAVEAHPASACFHRAKTDVAAGIKRYAPSSHSGLCWQERKRFSSERLAYIENPAAFGLRHVGNVEADTPCNSGLWSSRDECGWYSDPDGMTMQDGTGLTWGVVYQLPGRKGVARFVAGYQVGGTDAGPTLDLGTIYSLPTNGWHCDNHDNKAARSAAHVADSMARIAAEAEREYQEAYREGSCYADLGAELATVRTALLDTFRAMKGECARLRDLPEALRARLQASITADLAERETLLAKRAKIRDAGCYAPLRDAFNEGAGEVVFS